MKEKKDEHMVVGSKKKKRIIIGAIIVAVFLITILARPSIIVLGVYEDNENITASLEEQEPVVTIESLQFKLESAKQSLALYKGLSEQHQQELKDNSGELTDALVEKATLEATQSNFEITIKLLEERLEEKTFLLAEKEATLSQSERDSQEEIDGLTGEITTLQDGYDSLVENSAKNICCKNRVDNPSINYYDVINNKIICLEDGEKLLSC